MLFWESQNWEMWTCNFEETSLNSYLLQFWPFIIKLHWKKIRIMMKVTITFLNVFILWQKRGSIGLCIVDPNSFDSFKRWVFQSKHHLCLFQRPLSSRVKFHPPRSQEPLHLADLCYRIQILVLFTVLKCSLSFMAATKHIKEFWVNFMLTYGETTGKKHCFFNALV